MPTTLIRSARRAVSLWTVVVVVLTLGLISCADDADRTDAHGKTTIRFWHFQSEPGQRKALEATIQRFEAAHPDIRVELQELTWADGKTKLTAAFSSGTAPDLVELGSDWVAQFSSAGVLADQTGMGGDSLARFADYVVEPGRWKNGIYAWPWVADTRVLFVNTALISAAGFDASAVDSLWSDVLLRAERISKPPAVYGFGANGSDKHRLYKKILPFFWSNGGDVLDSSGRPVVNSQNNVVALQAYLDLARAGWVDNQKGLDQMFVAGKLAYWISGPWLVEKLARENPALRYRITMLPGFAGTQAVSFAGGEYLAICEDSRQKAAAKQLVTFLSSPQQALEFAKALPGGTTPADLTAASDPFLQSPTRRVLTQQLRRARMTPVHPKWLEIEEIVEYEVGAAILGEKDARSALDAAQLQLQQLLGLAPENIAG